MLIGLILIEGDSVSKDSLYISLSNAKQLVIGSVPGFGTILHVSAESSEYLGDALRAFANIKGVTGVITLAIRLQP